MSSTTRACTKIEYRKSNLLEEDLSKPEEPLVYGEEKLAFGYTSYSVTQKMTEPTGSPHVRGVAIYIPKLKDIPNLSVRIISSAGSALLTVYSVKINEDVAGYMQIAIEAQSLPPGAHPASGVHHCNILAIGKPV
jgi:hypothetical protein